MVWFNGGGKGYGKWSGGANQWGVQKRFIKPKDTSGGIVGQKQGTIEKTGSKFGFIKCEEYEEPVFILADELRQYKKGQVVKFTAFIDEQGKVQAKDLKSGLKSAGQSTGKRVYNPAWIPKPMWGQNRYPKPKDTSAGLLGEHIGIIEKRGSKFGFIQCNEWEEPVFILADELKQYKEGHKVRFTAFIDEQGKVQAKDLKSGLKEAPVSTPASTGSHGRGGKPKDTSGGILGEKTGIIEKRGFKFGFIQCLEFEEPVFVLADELKQYKEGHTIKFTAFIDNQGKVQAKDLKSGLK